MIRIYAIAFLLLFLTFSCSKKEEVQKGNSGITQYIKDSLSFDLPTGWKVKQDYTNSTGRYLELDKYSNYKVESTLGINILKDNPISDSVIANQVRELKYYYQKVKFQLLQQNNNFKLGKYNTVMAAYEADNIKDTIYGKICVIKDKNKTVTVQIIDRKPNADISDYNTIFNTITY